MPKLISESIRQHIIKIAEQSNFDVQLKSNNQDQYVKNLMFYSKQLNQTVYIRKDRAVGAGGVPVCFHVAVHPNGAVIWVNLDTDTCKKIVNEFQVKQ